MKKAVCRSPEYPRRSSGRRASDRFTDLDGKVEEVPRVFRHLHPAWIDHLNGVLFDHLSKLKRDRVMKKFTKAAKLRREIKRILRAEIDQMPLRLIFMGTPEFAVPTLLELVAHGHEIAAVYSREARPAGRGMKLQPGPVAREAPAPRPPVLTPKTLKTPEALLSFDTFVPDAAVVVAYGMILRRRSSCAAISLLQSARIVAAALARRRANRPCSHRHVRRKRRHGPEDGCRPRRRRHSPWPSRSPSPMRRRHRIYHDALAPLRLMMVRRWPRCRATARNSDESRSERRHRLRRRRSTRPRRASTGTGVRAMCSAAFMACRRFRAPGAEDCRWMADRAHSGSCVAAGGRRGIAGGTSSTTA